MKHGSPISTVVIVCSCLTLALTHNARAADKASVPEFTPELKLSILSAYSDTAPYDCLKLKRVFEQGFTHSQGYGGMGQVSMNAFVAQESAAGLCNSAHETAFEVKPVTDEMSHEYTLGSAFFKKSTAVQGGLIVASGKVSDYALLEAAFLIDHLMADAAPAVAQRIRDKKLLTVIVGHDELVTDLPQWHSDLTGQELHFYNWRNRGFFELDHNEHPTLLVTEEDLMEYEGGERDESVLVHEFGHVIEGAGFDKDLHSQLNDAYKHAKSHGLWRDGYAAQKFRRVKSKTPVNLLDALAKSFPAESRDFLKACMDGGDILVNGKPANSKVEVTTDDKVMIVFGGPKNCYCLVNQAEYWAEGVECWYDCNRVMDHDHNHIHTRDGIKSYDPDLAKILEQVLGDNTWRFVSPRTRAGKDHLAGYDPGKAPKIDLPDDIDEAGQDYYDQYWRSYWTRLHDKYPSIK